MAVTEENINYNIQYTVEGVDRSIRNTQRLLFFANAVRLSIQDLQQLRADFNLGQLLWTTIQLTRAWTALFRIIKATNQEQRRGTAQNLIGRAVGSRAGGVARGFAAGQLTLGGAATAQQGFLTTLAATLGISIPLLGTLTGGALFGAGLFVLKNRQVRMQQDWRQRQRDIARSQGLEF